jgi:hypothetical protein
MFLKNELLQKFKDDYSALINSKDRGSEVEIITQFSTLSSNFVSVFIGFENEKFTIHDNGWFFDGTYNSLEDFNIDKLIETASYFDVNCKNGRLYVETLNDELITAKAHDLSNCVQFLVNLVEIENLHEVS